MKRIVLLLILPAIMSGQTNVNLFDLLTSGADQNGNWYVDPLCDENKGRLIPNTSNYALQSCGEYCFIYEAIGDCPGCPTKESYHKLVYAECDSFNIVAIETIQGEECDLFFSDPRILYCHDSEIEYNWYDDQGVLLDQSQTLPSTFGEYTLIAEDQYGCIDEETVIIDGEDGLNIECPENDTICLVRNAVGEVCVDGQGLSVMWSTGSTNECIEEPAGIYTVTVTESEGCSAICEVEIIGIEPPDLVCNWRVLDPTLLPPYDFDSGNQANCEIDICPNGTADLLVSSGTVNQPRPDCTYTWTHSAGVPFIDLGDAIYFVDYPNTGNVDQIELIVDCSGCVDTITFDILSTAECIYEVTNINLQFLPIYQDSCSMLDVIGSGIEFEFVGDCCGVSNLSLDVEYDLIYDGSLVFTETVGSLDFECVGGNLLDPMPIETGVSICSYEVGTQIEIIYNVTNIESNGCTSDFASSYNEIYIITQNDLDACGCDPCDDVLELAQTGSVCDPLGANLLSSISGADSYLWNTGETTGDIFVMSDGTYCLTVTAGICEYVDCIDVDSDNCCDDCVLNLGIIPTASACAGCTGVINIQTSTAIGCTEPVTLNIPGIVNTFTINPGSVYTAGGVCPGTYSWFLEDANGCTGTGEFTVDGGSICSVSINGNGCSKFAQISGISCSITSCSWTGPNGFTSNSCTLLNLDVPGNYVLTVIDDDGCEHQANTNIGCGCVDCDPTLTVDASCNGFWSGCGGCNCSLQQLINGTWTNVNLGPGNFTALHDTWYRVRCDCNGCEKLSNILRTDCQDLFCQESCFASIFENDCIINYQFCGSSEYNCILRGRPIGSTNWITINQNSGFTGNDNWQYQVFCDYTGPGPCNDEFATTTTGTCPVDCEPCNIPNLSFDDEDCTITWGACSNPQYSCTLQSNVGGTWVNVDNSPPSYSVPSNLEGFTFRVNCVSDDCPTAAATISTSDCDCDCLMQPCNDGDVCTTNDMEGRDCGNQICQPCEGTPTSGNCVVESCDDGDDCTDNDVQEVDTCNGQICVPCGGEPIQPSASTNTIITPFTQIRQIGSICIFEFTVDVPFYDDCICCEILYTQMSDRSLISDSGIVVIGSSERNNTPCGNDESGTSGINACLIPVGDVFSFTGEITIEETTNTCGTSSLTGTYPFSLTYMFTQQDRDACGCP